MIVLTLRRCPPLLLLTLLAFSLGCTTAPPPQVAVEDTSLFVDPRLGFSGEIPSATAKRAESAWRAFTAGQLDESEKRFTDLRRRDPEYRPAILGLAAIALERQDLARAEVLIDEAVRGVESFAAVEIYRAELARQKGDLRRAYTLYKSLEGHPQAGRLAGPRSAQLGKDLFEQLHQRAMAEGAPSNAIPLFREALGIVESSGARLLLSQKLIELRRYDEARREIEPLLSTSQAEEPEVQLALAEIEAGRGRYDEAIARLERLVRRNPSPHHSRRLREIKRDWNEANLPPQYRMAVENQAITRADLAVLIYWRVSAVRFAQGLAEPPIAVDVVDVVGREEFIRALALRLYPVDSVTRQADPYRVVTVSNFNRVAFRVLALGGLPPCAREASSEQSESLRALRTLEDCLPAAKELRRAMDAPLSGRLADEILEQIDDLHRDG